MTFPYKTVRVDKRSKLVHRHIMEQKTGRHLEKWEDVHHIDGNKKNNSLNNLEILNHREHSGKTNKTRFRKTKGVLWNKKSGRWYGKKKKDGVFYSTKYFRNKADAETALKTLLLKISEGRA